MDDARVERLQLGEVETRRGAAEAAEIERVDQRRRIDERLDGQAGADPGQLGDQSLRLDPRLAQRLDAERAEPLRELALRADQQGLMRESGRRRAERLEHLQLEPGIGDMILAAHDMGHGHLDIVDRARQHVEPGAVGAADDGIAEQGGVEPLGPANEIVPGDRRVMIEPEAPMRTAPLRLQRAPLGRAQRQGGAIIDRGQAPPERDLALELQLLRRLPGRISAPRFGQPRQRRFIMVEARRLPLLTVRDEAKPGEIGANGLDVFLGRALLIGVVEPEQEAAPILPRPQPIVQRGADIADMEPSGRRWGEAGDDLHGGSPRAATAGPQAGGLVSAAGSSASTGR